MASLPIVEGMYKDKYLTQEEYLDMLFDEMFETVKKETGK